MRNRKTWLYIKAALILLFTAVIFIMPTEDTFRKWLRFGMLSLFVVSFIIDLNRYKKNNG
jgi:cell division protein FtsW (lipid II flippase)